MGREGQGRPPKLKLGPQNYFPGAGAGAIQLILRMERIVRRCHAAGACVDYYEQYL